MATLGERIGRWLASRSVENPTYPLTSQALIDLFGRSSKSGVSVTETTALRMGAVYRCVQIVAGTCASLPLKVYRDRVGVREELETPPLLLEPYPDMPPFVFWELVLTHLLLWGNAYLYKVRTERGGQWDIAKLLPLEPSQVRVRKGDATPSNPSGKEYRLYGGDEVFTPYDLLHIPGLGYDGLVGLSPVGLAREGIGVFLAGQETAAGLYGGGFHFPGYLSVENTSDPKTLLDYGRQFKQALVGGTPTDPKVPVFGKEVKYTPVGMSAEDAQFLSSRTFEVEEIARWFGVPLHLLAHTGATSNWGTGVAEHNRGLLTFTLLPWLRRTEQIVSLHLFARGTFVEWLTEGLLRPNTPERYEAHRTALDAGFLSIDEVRAIENREPVGWREIDLDLANAVGSLVRSGFDPIDTLRALGLPPIEHLGLLPVTLQDEEKFDADLAAAEVKAGVEEEPAAEEDEEEEVPADGA